VAKAMIPSTCVYAYILSAYVPPNNVEEQRDIIKYKRRRPHLYILQASTLDFENLKSGFTSVSAEVPKFCNSASHDASKRDSHCDGTAWKDEQYSFCKPHFSCSGKISVFVMKIEEGKPRGASDTVKVLSSGKRSQCDWALYF